MVTIKWHGHACVEVKSIDGFTIVFDPHDGESIGLKKPLVKADLVLVSHNHFDHNAVEVVSKENTRVLKEMHGELVINNIVIRGFKTYHDKYEGSRRGSNTIYYVEISGYKIVHMGDLGHIPPNNIIESIRRVNLLIIPTGGTYTVDPYEAWRIIELTEPLNILPIHYWIRGLTLPLYSIEEFLPHVKRYRVVKLTSNSFNLSEYTDSVILPQLE